MRRFYEDLWQRLPDASAPPELARRRRFLAAEVRAGERVLDLGCGDGAFLAQIAALGARPVGVDIAEAALARAAGRCPEAELHRGGDDAGIPLALASVDVVWCSETLEHVADTAGFLAEARRVLRPGGRLAVTVPRARRLRLALAPERELPPLGDHLRLYTAAALRDVLDDAGFGEVRVRRGGPLLLATARRP